jgi:uncharacterized repeat protein (TIGR03803 family)
VKSLKFPATMVVSSIYNYLARNRLARLLPAETKVLQKSYHWVLIPVLSSLTGGLPPQAAMHFERLRELAPVIDGAAPQSGLVQAADGALYGATLMGGERDIGTVFKLKSDGSGYTILFNFGGGRLVAGSDGALYLVGEGTNSAGGILRLDPNTSRNALLHSFGATADDGSIPSGLVEGWDGALYGSTTHGGLKDWLNTAGYGTWFRLNKDGSNYQVLHRFGADVPGGVSPPLLASDGNLYGTAGLKILAMNRDGSAYRVLHVFGVQESSLTAGLLEGNDGELYGMNGPDIFALKRDGTEFHVVYSLATTNGYYPHGLIEGPDGALYGSADGEDPQFTSFARIFKVNKNGSGFKTLHSFVGQLCCGNYTAAGLAIGKDGWLYGTTDRGGPFSTNAFDRLSGGMGTAFKLQTDGTGYTVVHDFGSATTHDGTIAASRLIAARDGLLYGTTADGGADNLGTLFRVNRDGSGYKLLSSLHVTPSRGLIEGSDGQFYGTGAPGGSVFTVGKDGNGYAVVHTADSLAFGGDSDLIESKDGVLYVTTEAGFTSGMGAILKLNKDGSAYTVLHQFGLFADGLAPRGGLLEGSDGVLYGTTWIGDPPNVTGAPFPGGLGVVFKMTKDGQYSVLHRFGQSPNEAVAPFGTLLEGSEGALYGVTLYRGQSDSDLSDNGGTVFKLDKNGNNYQILYASGPTDAQRFNPGTGLVEGADHALYGITRGYYDGNAATVYRVSKDGTSFASLSSFLPYASWPIFHPWPLSVTKGSDGALYGTTQGLEVGRPTTLFRLWPPETPDLSLSRTKGVPSEVTLLGLSGFRYRLEFSTDLLSWRTITNLLMDASGVHTENTPELHHGWFRAAWLP